MEVIAATERLTGRPVPWQTGAPACRRPGGRLRRSRPGSRADARLAPRTRPRRHRRLGVAVAQHASRRLRRLVVFLTLAVQPAEQHGDRRAGSWRSRWPAPGIRRSSAAPWASASWRASTVGTLSSSSPCITSSGRGANRRAASTGRKRRNSRAHSSNDRGKPGVRMAPISRACSRNRRGCAAQSSKSARGLSSAAPRTRGSSAATQVAIEPPVLVPTSQIPVGLASAMRWSIAARRSSTQPCSEKSPSLVPQPRNVNVIATQPSSLAIRSISSGNVPPLWRASSGPIGKPVAQDQPGQRAVTARRARQVARQDEVAGSELAVHARRGSGPWFALATDAPGPGQRVPAVAGLDQACRARSTGRSRLARSRRSRPRRPTCRGRRPAACACHRGTGCARNATAAACRLTLARCRSAMRG